MFGLLRKLSALLDNAMRDKTQNLELSSDHIPDSNCTTESQKWALDGLSHAMSSMKIFKEANTEHTIVCQKLTAVTGLVDLLRLNLNHHGLQNTLAHLGKLCYESQACSSRMVQLRGADLVVSCFENSITNKGICGMVIYVYGMLAMSPELHPSLLSSKVINMFVYGHSEFHTV